MLDLRTALVKILRQEYERALEDNDIEKALDLEIRIDRIIADARIIARTEEQGNIEKAG